MWSSHLDSVCRWSPPRFPGGCCVAVGGGEEGVRRWEREWEREVYLEVLRVSGVDNFWKSLFGARSIDSTWVEVSSEVHFLTLVGSDAIFLGGGGSEVKRRWVSSWHLGLLLTCKATPQVKQFARDLCLMIWACGQGNDSVGFTENDRSSFARVRVTLAGWRIGSSIESRVCVRVSVSRVVRGLTSC